MLGCRSLPTPDTAPRENLWKVTICVKRCTVPLTGRKVHFLSTRLTTLQRLIRCSVEEAAGTGGTLTSQRACRRLRPRVRWGTENSAAALQTAVSSKMPSPTTTLHAPTPPLGIYPEELKPGSGRGICSPAFVAALFAIVKRQKHLKRPSADGWANSRWGGRTPARLAALTPGSDEPGNPLPSRRASAVCLCLPAGSTAPQLPGATQMAGAGAGGGICRAAVQWAERSSPASWKSSRGREKSRPSWEKVTATEPWHDAGSSHAAVQRRGRTGAVFLA